MYINNFLNKKNSTRDLSDAEFENIVFVLAKELEQISFYTDYGDSQLMKDWLDLLNWNKIRNIYNNKFLEQDLESNKEPLSIASRSRIGVKLCEHFFPNFYDIENKKGDSFKKMWVADNLVKMLRWNRKSHSTPYLSEIKRGIYFNFGLPKSTIYRPQMAKMIVTGLNGEVVLDPCAGWGGRLLGAVSSNAHYIGFEPNIKTYNGLLKLSKFLNIQDKVTLICDDALNMDKYDIGEVDIVLTSPPYFNLEVYSHEKTQSIYNNKTYDDWLDNFLNPLVNLCLSKLKDGGWSCWNVHNIGKMKMIDDIENLHKDFSNVKEFSIVSPARHVSYTKKVNKKNKDLTRCFQKNV